MSNITFTIRWREELKAASNEGILIFEITMGKLHVYFPDHPCWRRQAPAWAMDRWEEYKAACERGCAQNKIPFSIADNALMYEEK